MKTFLFIACMLTFTCLHAQSVKTDKDGNFYSARVQNGFSKSPAKETGKTFTDSKGKVYPVYTNSKGKLFVTKVSGKTGKEYRYYLKVE